ncbi:MAG: nitroreductase family protein [Eubacteriales bacterium]|nr:nitroreductase family protein [Eubacteriales bacterium]
MITINKTSCIGCGKCVNDCVGRVLSLKGGKAEVSDNCIHCGHCVAICPTAAVSIPEYDMDDVREYSSEDVRLNPNNLLNAIKFRRSIRNFRPNKIEDEKLKLILEAGRYTATAKNTQGCRFVIVQKELQQFKEVFWDAIGKALMFPHEEIPVSAKICRRFYKERTEDPNSDFIFRNSPAILLIASDRLDDAGLAAQNMELMAISLGLGVLYNGYLCRAANEISEANEWLEAGDKPFAIAMLIGYPAVTFLRNAPRKPGDFILK